MENTEKASMRYHTNWGTREHWGMGLQRKNRYFLDPSNTNRDLIVTTCLSLVLFTTVFFGSTIGLLSVCLFEKKNDDALVEDVDEEEEDDPQNSIFNETSSSSSQRSLLQHPNAED